MADAAMRERWLPVPGWDGLYEVSDLGRVRSLDRTVPHRYSGQVTLRGRVLRQCPSPPFGYLLVNLSAGGIERTRYVHQLVAEAFHGPRPAGNEVRHGPGGMLDNSAANLCWGTPVANAQDKNRDGTVYQRARTVCPRRHPLVEPNLHAATARKGHRECLACSRAMSYIRHARDRHGLVLDLQTVSDRYFTEIMPAA